MKKNLLTVLCLMSLGFSYSQTKSEIDKSISTLENLLYKETYLLDEKMFNQTKFIYHQNEGRLEVNNYAYVDKDGWFKSDKSFYLTDIDKNNLRYDLLEVGTDSYVINISISAKEKTIISNVVTFNKRTFPSPISKTDFVSEFSISSNRGLPRVLALRVVENIRILIGAKDYKKVVLFKS